MGDCSDETLKWISEEYHDLNGSHFDTLETLPSALQFSQFVRVSRPVLIRDCPVPKAFARWDDEYLARQCGENLISVACTPSGRADAITKGPDDRLYFAEPHVEQMTMKELLHKLSTGDGSNDAEVLYLQSQDGNLHSSNPGVLSEFQSLLTDVPDQLSFATEALGSPPDAVNLWIGDSRSVTSIHSDPYENIYSVIRGSKTFTVFPPTEAWCMEERIYPHAAYHRFGEGSPLELIPSGEDAPPVRWSSILDPTDASSLRPEAHSIHITVSAGESLYLPAGWWHYVRQTEVTIAVNYWYDMESRGTGWVWLNLLRGGASEKEPPPGNEDDELVPSTESHDDEDCDGKIAVPDNSAM